MDGLFGAEHQDAGQRKATFSGLTIFPPGFNLPEELHVVEGVPCVTGLAELEQLAVLVDGGLVEIFLQRIVLEDGGVQRMNQKVWMQR